MKVAVLGAAGGIGQSLSLLLKTQLPAGSELALYDLSPVTPGIAVDLSHIPTAVKVTGFAGEDPDPALQGADIVVIPAGVARKPGMHRADLFKVNAGVVKNLVEHCARICPTACICIITNPVNTTVPIAAEVLKLAGVYDPRKLFGITMLDVIRAETFIAETKGLEPGSVKVPIIGGHSSPTILPLLSQVEVCGCSLDEVHGLTDHIQNAGTEVVQAKAGGGSATLAMAQAGWLFLQELIRGLSGEPDVVEYAFVQGDPRYGTFFSQPVRFGPEGIAEVLEVGPLNAEEQQALERLLPILQADIQAGIDFVHQSQTENIA